jgi:hypothetical protein
MSDSRISELSKRFSRHATKGGGRPPETTKTRERKSFYLDSDLVNRLDQAYRTLNHDLFPQQISKSTFLETILERGLTNIDELKTVLSQISDSE